MREKKSQKKRRKIRNEKSILRNREKSFYGKNVEKEKLSRDILERKGKIVEVKKKIKENDS